MKYQRKFFNKRLLQQRDETTELSLKLKTAIDSENKLKILSKKNQYEITRANELRKISEDMIVIKKNHLQYSDNTMLERRY